MKMLSRAEVGLKRMQTARSRTRKDDKFIWQEKFVGDVFGTLEFLEVKKLAAIINFIIGRTIPLFV